MGRSTNLNHQNIDKNKGYTNPSTLLDHNYAIGLFRKTALLQRQYSARKKARQMISNKRRLPVIH